jgi:hypothetical protein
MMIAMLKIPQERRGKKTGRLMMARIWIVIDPTVYAHS